MSRPNSNEAALDADFLLMAYCNGYFPMAASKSGHIEWFSPDPRAIIPLETFHVSHSLKRVIASKRFELKVNEKFETVIRACAERDETWISGDIIKVYTELHRRGFAHSVESWHEGKLVGGLYGVAIRGAFFGESMFSRMTDASKVALAFLVERMKERGYSLLDTQFMTEHLRTFGTKEVSREEYLELLSRALEIRTTIT